MIPIQEPQPPQAWAPPTLANPTAVAPTTQSEGFALHVSRLHKELDEKKLYDYCCSFMPNITIISVRVCRDWHTHTSLGYAYVNVDRREDAVKLINLMNHTELEGKRLRVSWKRQGKLPAEANLFLSKLNSLTDVRKLEKLCAPFGEIASADVKVYSGTANGYVQFYTVESAQKAIEALNGVEVDGNTISVAIFIPKEQRQTKYTNIFVKNFEENVTVEQLENFFSKYGTITSTYIGVDSQNVRKVKAHDDGVKTCYGFVNFSTHEEALLAINEANGATFPGTEHLLSISVTRGLSKAERRQEYAKNRTPDYSRCLYISFIHKDVGKEELLQLFSRFGKVSWFNLATDAEHKSLGYGYCYYETREECESAKNALQNYEIRGSNLKADFYKTKAELVSEKAMNATRSPQQQYAYPNVAFPFLYPGGTRYPKGSGNRPNRGRKRQAMPMGVQYPQQQAQPTQPVGAQPLPQMVANTRPNATETLVNIQPVSDAEFTSMTDDDRHEVFGERIYNYLTEVHPEINPGKITGMVLESFKNNFEHLNGIIRNGNIVNKIAEAIAVFQQHQTPKE